MMATTATQTDPTQAPSYLQQYLSQQQAGGVDPAQMTQRVNAAATNSQVPNQSGVIKSANQAVNNLPANMKPVGQAAVSSFQGQVQAAQKGAANQAEALKTKNEATQVYVAGLNALGQSAVQSGADSVAAWNKYTLSADQYLKDSAARMAQVTGDIKKTIDDYAKTNDAALAHSIQSSSYAWLQTNKATERAIAERYGTDSAEYQGFQESKRASIGAMVSDLTAKAWDRTQQILNTGIGVLAGSETQLATDVNLAQKNSLDALQAAAAAGDQYRLNTTSYLMTIEAAKNTAWGDLAEWLDNSPVTAVDAQPLLAQLLDLQQSSQPVNSVQMVNTPASWSKGPTSGSGRRALA